MIAESPLDRLAQLCGIELQYQDVWGNTHTASDETKRALLEAMGFHLGDESRIEALIAEYEAQLRQRLVDPVLVIPENSSPIAVRLRIPMGHVREDFEWVLAMEQGGQSAGSFTPANAERKETCRMAGETFLHCMLVLDIKPDTGYHQLDIRHHDNATISGTSRLIVTPKRCYIPPALQDTDRVWGPAVQLYALRSQRNWGIGDCTDLKNLVEYCAGTGAGIIGLNPLHSLFSVEPQWASPYRPSSRIFYNFLYLDVESIQDVSECDKAQQVIRNPEFQARLTALRDTERVDYGEVAAVKTAVLEILYEHFKRNHLDPESERGRSFREFQARGGESLHKYSVFETLREHFHNEHGTVGGWQDWPEAYQNPQSETVEAFASAHQDKAEFFQYLQWQMGIQLGAAGSLAMACRFKVGLYQDLSVCAGPGGFETWLHQGAYALDASIGAPPDIFNANGQDWGLPPPIPTKLMDAAYGPFVAAIRANMRHAGAIRIDHVMGLLRLFWLPKGKPPSEGAYVRYPFRDLLGILALESQRNQCMVVGEDLGTVPDGVGQGLEDYQILSCRLLYFEKGADGKFKPPDEYPPRSLAAVTTHDLPTLFSYWQGQDLALRTELGLFPTEERRQAEVIERNQDKFRLLYALKREHMLPESIDVDAPALPDMSSDLVTAIYRFLAASPAKVVAFQLEDAFGQIQQANVPGTTSEYPNWRQKLSVSLEDFPEHASLESLVAGLCLQRGVGSMPASSVLPYGQSEAFEPVIPVATYRLQFHKDFNFSQAAHVVPYLRQLGISHCYASPYLKARPGSAHGYDIVDHGKLNPELGRWEDFEYFVNTLQQHDMGQLLDIVPNHMAAGTDNPWWVDVLENGRASRYAGFFDIAWDPLKDELRDKVLLPILEDHYGLVLEKGLLQLLFDHNNGEFKIRYYDHYFPLDPVSYALILGDGLKRLKNRAGENDVFFPEFQSLTAGFKNLPKHWEATDENVETRMRDKQVHKKRLARLCRESREIRQFIEENVVRFNGSSDDPDSYDRLDAVLRAQPFRLAYWRVASDDINYRRFFDINDLAALRMENREVFDRTHQFVLDLVVQKKIQGLRIDHIDGLYDPRQYCQWLQEEIRNRTHMQLETAPNSTDIEKEPLRNRFYLVAEKILAGYESLRSDWPVHGTTGYDFANLVGGLFVDATHERDMDRIYTRFIGRKIDFDELLYDCKKLIMKTAMASEFNVLANQLNLIAEAHRYTRDFTVNNLRDALHEVAAWFPVYRTYVRKDSVTDEDRRFVDWAVRRAKSKSRAADTSVYHFIHRVLVLDALDETNSRRRDMIVHFAMKFQQMTGPIMAKGLEDTSFYIFNRLLSLNEVGGDPRYFGVSVKAFHLANSEKSAQWPHAMLDTSTHDSKRSEDVRARICVLSEIPDIWGKQIKRWSRLNRSKKRKVDGVLAPSKNDEYALYQILIGAWPLEDYRRDGHNSFTERIVNYMVKAVKEAKVHSSWINPNSEYEDAVIGFIQKLFENEQGSRFFEDFVPFQKQVARLGINNSLSQVLLKLTVPGVPDIYQGNEIWDFSLVDPDNRRPVDFALRQDMLRDLKDFVSVPHEQLLRRARELMDRPEDGRIKLYVTWKTLSLRLQYQDVFQHGAYIPLDVYGEKREHICAFARKRADGKACIIAVPRLLAKLIGFESRDTPASPAVWSDTQVEIPSVVQGTEFQNIFTGEPIEGKMQDGRMACLAGELFANFPVALLIPAPRNLADRVERDHQ